MGLSILERGGLSLLGGALLDDGASLYLRKDAQVVLYGDHKSQGMLTVAAIGNPGTPTITPKGTTGSTTYGYKIVATVAGEDSAASSEGTTATGNATLSGTNYNEVSWSRVLGATGYKVYRTTGGASQGLISTITDGGTTVLNDTGLAGGGETASSANSTGCLVLDNGKGIRTGKTASDAFLLQAYDVDGAVWTTFITLTAGNTPSCTIANPTFSGTALASGTFTMPAFTLGGAVAGGDQAFTNVGDMTFATGSIIASGSTNGNTLILRANDTTFITFTTGATDVCTLAGVTLSGTILASGTVTLPAFTAGGTITIGANLGDIVRRAVDNDLIAFGGGTDSGSPYWQMNGKSRGTNPGAVYLNTPNAALAETSRMTFSQAADTISLTWNAVYHIGMKFGLAGTATGAFTMDGATSGVVTVKVAAAAGTWTMTLPATTGTVGQQLATDGAGICSWTDAASRREFKNIVGEHSPQDALDKILNTRVYDFHYKEGKGTGDRDTLYTGIMADEAPWAMHYQGGVVNPVNTLGFMVLGFQAHEERIKDLEDELKLLKAGRA